MSISGPVKFEQIHRIRFIYRYTDLLQQSLLAVSGNDVKFKKQQNNFSINVISASILTSNSIFNRFSSKF